jgi:hypothetical protein
MTASVAALLLPITLVAGQAGDAEPLESWTNIRIEQAVDGTCATIRAGRAVDAPVMVMDGVCHGWRSQTCGDKIWFQGDGVTHDEAQVLFAAADRTLDVTSLIDDEVARRWPEREVLHLRFQPPTCEASTLVVRYSGSHVKSDGGPASGMKGEVRISGPASHTLTLKPDR